MRTAMQMVSSAKLGLLVNQMTQEERGAVGTRLPTRYNGSPDVQRGACSRGAINTSKVQTRLAQEQ